MVPYMHQLTCGQPLQPLGRGRSGNATLVRWGHHRRCEGTYFYDRYEHELEVLLDLRDLWRLFVPALLLHNPWRTEPCIGLQLGQQINEDDIGLWSDADQEMLATTLSVLAARGWYQDDYRGCNFMRLKGTDGKERIAAIDFESFVKEGADSV